MEENKKWRMHYSECPDSDKGIENIGKKIIHIMLALIVLGLVYTLFAKTTWDPAVSSSRIKTNAAEPSVVDASDDL